MLRARVAAVATLLLSLSGCSGDGAAAPAPTPTASGAEVISHHGLGPIQFGDRREELERDHGLVQQPGDCAPQLPAYPSASPVFDEGRLVLLWANPPLQTPNGLAVGSPVAEVHSAHPDAERLPAPRDSFRFDAVLEKIDDRAFLFLHDGETVQKLIVGYHEHARRVLDENFGTC